MKLQLRVLSIEYQSTHPRSERENRPVLNRPDRRSDQALDERTRRTAAAQSSSVRTLIVRPLRAEWKETFPGRVAKIVWSRPRPTPSPGQKRVPRWRTMISPPWTCWPANTLTPSIFGFDSRPFREEPRPFLCAPRNHLPRKLCRHRLFSSRLWRL